MDCLVGVLVSLRKCPEEQIIGVEALSRLTICALDFREPKPGLYRADDTARDLILQFKDVVQRSVKAISPNVSASRRVDKLASDANAVTGFAYAAFENVAHSKFTTHLLHVSRPAFVGKARIPCDHKQPRQPRNRRCDLFDNAVYEIVLFSVPGHVLEWQNRNRRLVR